MVNCIIEAPCASLSTFNILVEDNSSFDQVWAHIEDLYSPEILDQSALLFCNGREFTGLRDSKDVCFLKLVARLPGGKGGFGSQLRAAGGRMASRRSKGEANNQSCRDLNGRRLRVADEAKKVEELLQSATAAEKQKLEKKKAKLEKIIAGEGQNAVRLNVDLDTWEEELEEGRQGIKSALGKSLNNVASSSKTSGRSSKAITGVKRSAKLAGWDDESDTEEEEEEDSEQESKSSESEIVSVAVQEQHKEESRSDFEGKGKAKLDDQVKSVKISRVKACA